MLIYAEKNNCTDCKFLIDFKKKILLNFNQKTSEEIILYFQHPCRQNYSNFYSLFLLLKSITAIEKKR